MNSRKAHFGSWCDRFTQAVCNAVFIAVLAFGMWANVPPQRPDIIDEYASELFTEINLVDVLSLSSKDILSDDDKSLYKQIFAAQKSGNWAVADSHIKEIKNNILIGDVLAERYLHRNYDTSAQEMLLWLKDYPNYSQKDAILELAANKYPQMFSNLDNVKKSPRLLGYGDNSGSEIRFDDGSQAQKLWKSGIEAWRSGKKSDAAKAFSSIAGQDDLSDWQYSAANFWAYRAYLSLGDQGKAREHLNKAANNSRVFYGILARKHLKKPLNLDTKPIEVSEGDIERLVTKPKMQRILALAQIGFGEKASEQMRFLFPTVSKAEKWGMLAIAKHFNLSSVQISMAKQLEKEGRELDALKYPIPDWQPEKGFSIDPHLIYALIRHESGFHSAAVSSAGAMGLMQLMPRTADMMLSRNAKTKNYVSNVSEPVLNITLGEKYIEHLLSNKLVEGNLFYMLTAYNAGIGRLKEWKDTIDYKDDYLLFLESIPYSETRHYVMQVMNNYWIYSELEGDSGNIIASSSPVRTAALENNQ